MGLIVHEIGDPYFSEIASGVLRVATGLGLTVQICHTGRDPENELRQIRSLVTNRVGAILVAGSGFVDAAVEAPAKRELQRYASSGGRVAVIGRHHLGTDAVLPDNVEGGRAVAEHVLSLGHRRIAIVSGSTELSTVADRLEGHQERARGRARAVQGRAGPRGRVHAGRRSGVRAHGCWPTTRTSPRSWL